MKNLLNKGKEIIKKNIPHSVKVGAASLLLGVLTLQSCNKDYSFQGTEQEKKELINKASNIPEDHNIDVSYYKDGIIKIKIKNASIDNKKVLYKAEYDLLDDVEKTESALGERVIIINKKTNTIEGFEIHKRSDGTTKTNKLDDDLIKDIIETYNGDNIKLYNGGAGDESY